MPKHELQEAGLGATQQLGEIISATRYGGLGEKCVCRVKQAIADGIAVSPAGRVGRDGCGGSRGASSQ